MLRNFTIKPFNFTLFGAGELVNGTSQYINSNTPAESVNYEPGAGLTPEMKTYYSDYLIDLASPELVHMQLGQKHPIPKNGGKVIEFRKYDPLPKLTTPLQEAVTPKGQKLNVTTIESTVHQYGGYVELSDMLLLSAIDNNLVHATELIATQAGETLDTVVREILNAGTNVQIGDGTVSARYLLKADKTGVGSKNDYLTVDYLKRAVLALKNQNAPKIDGSYVAIIHPSCAYELTKDPEWLFPHQYQDTKNIYENELGMVAGVRFLESTEAKVWHAKDLAEDRRELKAASASGATITISGSLTSEDQTAIVGRKVIVGTELFTVESAGSNSITLDREPDSGNTVTSSTIIYPGEAGAEGKDVYSTLVFAKNAYGVTEIEGGGLKHIVKQLGSAGTADALDQRATVGWKATLTAEILVQQYMVRIESTVSNSKVM